MYKLYRPAQDKFLDPYGGNMNLFQKYLIGEFTEEYEEGRLTRREALKMIASITGSLALANTILAACAPPPEDAAVTEPTGAIILEPTNVAAPAHGTVAPQDPAIESSAVEFQSDTGMVQGYLAHPKEEGAFPVVLVCHENRGLTDHIRDVTRRFAKAGYTSLAVDLLSRQGGTAAFSSSDVPGALSAIDPDQFVQDFRNGWVFLQGQPFAQAEQVGMTGFCFGGGVTWRVATQMPELLAAVPFYGPHPDTADAPAIRAAVLAIYAERDQRINQGIAAIEEAMEQNQKTYEKIIYPNADHAFFNDTGTRYNPEAAQDAWERMLAWFDQYLA
jgi:carboxymethylenebutenolidase